jgi:hypothetical protein
MKATPLSQLAWELTVLSQAVVFPNLSAASQQIGISQPQLSRIVAKIEKALGVVLLNREVKRRATWTPIATELAQTFGRGSRHLEAELQRLIEDSPIRRLRMGTLEGLLPTASEIGHKLISKLELEALELDVFDLNELEERFLRGDLDIVLTMREPGRRKYSFSKVLGYQTLEEKTRQTKGALVLIRSGYEYQSQSSRKKPESAEAKSTLVSNSLSLRRYWMENYGGRGLFPSALHGRSSSDKSETPVILLGQESLGSRAWKLISG